MSLPGAEGLNPSPEVPHAGATLPGHHAHGRRSLYLRRASLFIVRNSAVQWGRSPDRSRNVRGDRPATPDARLEALGSGDPQGTPCRTALRGQIPRSVSRLAGTGAAAEDSRCTFA